MGAANKVQGNKITGIKVLKKTKSCLSLVKMRSSLIRFYKKVFFSNLNISRGVFISIAPFFNVCKHPLFPCIFYSNRTFLGTFLYFYILEPENNILKTLFPKTFSTGHFQCQNLGLYFRKLFSQNFFGGHRSTRSFCCN